MIFEILQLRQALDNYYTDDKYGYFDSDPCNDEKGFEGREVMQMRAAPDADGEQSHFQPE